MPNTSYYSGREKARSDVPNGSFHFNGYCFHLAMCLGIFFDVLWKIRLQIKLVFGVRVEDSYIVLNVTSMLKLNLY